jgi:hypothetical protein
LISKKKPESDFGIYRQSLKSAESPRSRPIIARAEGHPAKVAFLACSGLSGSVARIIGKIASLDVSGARRSGELMIIDVRLRSM